ncbi:hypothetical protein E8E14_009045 [Neopestalotiopsis sp. 37M]|nr:hypothetical protein E8E14_009045 [Neopestalotiopsis sp. 37M]
MGPSTTTTGRRHGPGLSFLNRLSDNEFEILFRQIPAMLIHSPVFRPLVSDDLTGATAAAAVVDIYLRAVLLPQLAALLRPGRELAALRHSHLRMLRLFVAMDRVTHLLDDRLQHGRRGQQQQHVHGDDDDFFTRALLLDATSGSRGVVLCVLDILGGMRPQLEDMAMVHLERLGRRRRQRLGAGRGIQWHGRRMGRRGGHPWADDDDDEEEEEEEEDGVAMGVDGLRSSLLRSMGRQIPDDNDGDGDGGEIDEPLQETIVRTMVQLLVAEYLMVVSYHELVTTIEWMEGLFNMYT